MGSKKDDSFDPAFSTMSLGDHLEELRARIIMALMGLFLGTIICFFFGKKIIVFMERPYMDVMKSHQAKAMADPNSSLQSTLFNVFCSELLAALKSDPNAPDINPNTVQYLQSIYSQAYQKINSPDFPNKGKLKFGSASSYQLITLAPADAFISYMKISIISGLILTAPWVFYQLWMFIAAGLYANERRYVHIAVPFSAGLFILGALFFLFVIAPLSLKFFLGFNNIIGVSSNWTFQKYISFVTTLMFVFGVAFQTPIAIFILTRTGIVSIPALKSARKYVILSVFIIAAAATPPDVVSQVSLALPLYVLYELGIYISSTVIKKKENTPSEEDA